MEKERQNQHIEYLKDSHKTQIKNMEQLHAENLDAAGAEWKVKKHQVVREVNKSCLVANDLKFKLKVKS